MSETPTNRVTIAIPTLNRASYLRSAIASALAQTYTNLEVLVSNNLSSDETDEVLASFSFDTRFRVIEQSVRLTMVENWNSCIDASTGEYFLLLSDDDLLDPEAIAKLVDGFERGPLPQDKVGVVYCRGRVIDENGKMTYVGPPSPLIEQAEKMIIEFFNSRRATWACTILFRKSDIAGGYTARLPLATDAAQWMQAVAKHGHAVFVNHVLASYRVHRNISAMTPVLTWQKENLALAHYAVETLRSAQSTRNETDEDILRSCEKLCIRIVPALINQRFEREKLNAMKAYGQNLRNFTSLYGGFCMLKGIFELMLPNVLGTIRRNRKPVTS